ncbi:zinc metallopeptidase putative [Novosphingobium nitrogenifigens DSM 19370]|uniref:Zinc metallopeptidase putative n=1 Tax=Novosphingobium nitrogenifigens DSM 19370 TaxID=983920 RepID=F1ZAA5_9SPHN|nr:neutral zinc metallopeptidase [Novosphingobium nitrogenifigens]EGD58487.1 zinc metallopeptidase putative [Novosphingobium nitrogenifigens DSM 19370]
MRLDDYDSSIDVEDQRGRSFGGGGGFGGLPMWLLFTVWRMFGCTGVAVLLGGVALFGAFQFAAHGPVGGSSAVQGGHTLQQSCNINAYSHESCNALSSLDKTWKPVLARMDVPFRAPKLVFYSREGESGCGEAQSAMGPFYCPSDMGIYLDTSFYDELAGKLGAGGDFARVYVIAHEFGHHVQNLLGTSDKVRTAQERNPGEANPLSVKLELQADCYAGVWAALNKDRIEAGDIESGLKAAHQIGDDTLMKEAGRTPVEAAFTHGSAEQRMHWLKTGLDSGGNPKACDTFKGND